jgi:hypothetical protein
LQKNLKQPAASGNHMATNCPFLAQLGAMPAAGQRRIGLAPLPPGRAAKSPAVTGQDILSRTDRRHYGTRITRSVRAPLIASSP